jgi:hypothetical protein
MRNTQNILVGNAEGNRSVGIQRYKWEGNTEMGIKELEC